MDAKKKQVEGDEYREEYRDDYREDYREEYRQEFGSARNDPSEFEVPEEMEAWALDDLSDLVPTTFD